MMALRHVVVTFVGLLLATGVGCGDGDLQSCPGICGDVQELCGDIEFNYDSCTARCNVIAEDKFALRPYRECVAASPTCVGAQQCAL